MHLPGCLTLHINIVDPENCLYINIMDPISFKRHYSDIDLMKLYDFGEKEVLVSWEELYFVEPKGTRGPQTIAD